ncbi:DUF1129 domain-containing protein [Limosilactobacillus sp.]|uniref:DUF1129 domain-containing protein n=1 Tax=Limosilactobacillus sp. TaxID=2773925 RepID=UPI0035A140A3
MSEERARNAAAGQRQKQHIKAQRQAQDNTFSEYHLTRKNEEFMYQLNKQLDRQGVASEKQPAMLKETAEQLVAGQKKGKTAKTLFGTPTDRAKELKHPKPSTQHMTRRSIKLLAIDNTLIFLSIFTFMYFLMFWLSPLAMRSSRAGSSGITAILLVAILGGILYGYVAMQLQPTRNKDGKWVQTKPMWFRVLTVAFGLVAWLAVYMLVSLLPNIVNPRLNRWVYLIIAVAAFVGDIVYRRKYHVTGGFYGNRRRR